MGETSAALIGFITGGSLGGGFYILRRKAWPVVWALAMAAMIVAGLVALVFGFGLLGSMGKGGDAFMNTLTVAIFAAGGLGIALAAMLLIGGIQSGTVGRPAIRVMATVFLDAITIAAAFWAYQTWVLEPSQSAITDAWWQEELARREERQRQHDKIPPQFRDWSIARLDAQRRQERMMAQQGIKVKSPISQEVENAIRNYEYGSTAAVPIPDRSGYARGSESRRAFSLALGVGWLVGALVLPIGLGAVGLGRTGEAD